MSTSESDDTVKKKLYYSQNDEEKFIMEHFKDSPPGRFLDIGAYNGKDFSNTYALVEKGWGGLCVEPSPKVFVDLLALHGKNDGIELLNAAITLGGGFCPFWDSSGDAISTTQLAHKDKWEKGWNVDYKQFYVYAITPLQLVTQFGINFEFINVDVEGFSADLFKALPIHLFKACKLICIEHDNQDGAIALKCSKLGYQVVAFNGENIIMGR